MPRLSTTHRRKKKHSVGDMRERITLHIRSITPPVYGSVKALETYDTGTLVWASVKTFDLIAAGQKLFDGVDPSEQPSHLFVIRWREFLEDCETKITSEIIIRWRGNAYRITKIIDPEERHEYYELYSTLWGDQTKEANR